MHADGSRAEFQDAAVASLAVTATVRIMTSERPTKLAPSHITKAASKGAMRWEYTGTPRF